MPNAQEMNAPMEGESASNEELVDHPGASIRPDLFEGVKVTKEQREEWLATRERMLLKHNASAATMIEESAPFGDTANFLTQEEMDAKVAGRELEDKR